MVAHERVGDRADHPHGAGAETLVERVLEKDDVGCAVGQRLVVHPMVGDEPDDGAERDKSSHLVVDRAVKGVGLGIARRMRMLDIIRQRQIEQIGVPALEQRDPGIEHE